MNLRISSSFQNLLYAFLVILLFFFLQSSRSLPTWQGPCHLQESGFVSTTCRILLCPLSPACSSSSIWVRFSVSHSPSIFCTSLPVHSSYNIVFSQMSLSHFSKFFAVTSCTLPFPHLKHLFLLVFAHHSVRYFVTSLFLSTEILFFGCGFPLPDSENWPHTARLRTPLLVPAEPSLLSSPP